MKSTHYKRKKQQKQRRELPEPTIFVVNRRAEVIQCQVDDPYFNRAYSEGTSGNSRKIPANVNARESPALWMFIHNNIDAAQFEAAKKFRRLYEAAQGTGIQSQDFTKEPVDGGRIAEPLTDRRQRAAKALNDVHDTLGRAGYMLVESVCGHCMEITELYPTDWARRRERSNLKHCLERLVTFWGLKAQRGFYYRDAKNQRRAV